MQSSGSSRARHSTPRPHPHTQCSRARRLWSSAASCQAQSSRIRTVSRTSLHVGTAFSLQLRRCVLPYMSHPYPIPIPSLSHPYPIPILSLSYPYPIPIPSLSHPCPIPRASRSCPVPTTSYLPPPTHHRLLQPTYCLLPPLTHSPLPLSSLCRVPRAHTRAAPHESAGRCGYNCERGCSRFARRTAGGSTSTHTRGEL